MAQDKELAAMASIQRTLTKLPRQACQRVVNWVESRGADGFQPAQEAKAYSAPGQIIQPAAQVEKTS